MYLAGGVCWLLFALGFVFFIIEFFADGAGLQFLGFLPAVSSGSLLLGLVWLTGFLTAAGICLVVSLWLFKRGGSSTE